MIESLIGLVILLVVLIVIYYILSLACAHFGAPPIIGQLIGLVLLLIFLLAALRAYGVSPRLW